MSKYVIIHGTGGVGMWIPWLQKKLREKDGKVWVPEMPNPERAVLKEQLPFMLQSGNITQGTTIIAHSAGCPLVLSILENLEKPIKKVILVAGYIKPHKGGSNPDPILQKRYNWGKIKKSAKEFVFIVSDNDPWGCGEEMNRPAFEKLGGTFVVVKGGGHFGSNTFKSPLYKFPLLLSLV